MSQWKCLQRMSVETRKPLSGAQLLSFWGLLCLHSTEMISRRLFEQRSYGRRFCCDPRRIFVDIAFDAPKSFHSFVDSLFYLSCLWKIQRDSNPEEFLKIWFLQEALSKFMFLSFLMLSSLHYSRFSFIIFLQLLCEILLASIWSVTLLVPNNLYSSA